MAAVYDVVVKLMCEEEIRIRVSNPPQNFVKNIIQLTSNPLCSQLTIQGDKDVLIFSLSSMQYLHIKQVK